MADHERRQQRGTRAQIGQPGLDARGLLGERLAARVAERRVRALRSARSRRGPRRWTSANERSVQSPVSVSAKRASSTGCRPIRAATTSAVSRARAQRAAPQRDDLHPRGDLGQGARPARARWRRAARADGPGSGPRGCRPSARGGPGGWSCAAVRLLRLVGPDEHGDLGAVGERARVGVHRLDLGGGHAEDLGHVERGRAGLGLVEDLGGRARPGWWCRWSRRWARCSPCVVSLSAAPRASPVTVVPLSTASGTRLAVDLAGALRRRRRRWRWWRSSTVGWATVLGLGVGLVAAAAEEQEARPTATTAIAATTAPTMAAMRAPRGAVVGVRPRPAAGGGARRQRGRRRRGAAAGRGGRGGGRRRTGGGARGADGGGAGEAGGGRRRGGGGARAAAAVAAGARRLGLGLGGLGLRAEGASGAAAARRGGLARASGAPRRPGVRRPRGSPAWPRCPAPAPPRAAGAVLGRRRAGLGARSWPALPPRRPRRWRGAAMPGRGRRGRLCWAAGVAGAGAAAPARPAPASRGAARRPSRAPRARRRARARGPPIRAGA